MMIVFIAPVSFGDVSAIPTLYPASHPIDAVLPEDIENYDDENANNISFAPSKEVTPVISVGGWIYYMDRDEVKRPFAAATVEIYDEDFLNPDDFLGKTLTDDEGYFRLDNIPNVDISGGRDVYVKVGAVNNMWAVRHIQLDVLRMDLAPVYKWRSKTYSDVKDGSTVYIAGNTQGRGWVLPDEDRGAMRIFQDIRVASSFAVLHGHHPYDDDSEFYENQRYLNCYFPSPELVRAFTGGISVYLPYSFKAGMDKFPYPLNLLIASNVLADTNIIFMEPDRKADVTYHEYGHYMMDAAYGEVWPTLDNVSEVIGYHSFEKPSNLIRAWSEGWADFVGACVRDYAKGREYGIYNWHEMEAEVRTSTLDKWKRTEGAIARSLYDIYDKSTHPAEVGSDNLNIGFAEIWDILWENRMDTVDDFWGTWQVRGLPVEKAWVIFALNGIRLSWQEVTPLPGVSVTWNADTLPPSLYNINSDIVIDPEFTLTIRSGSEWVKLEFPGVDEHNLGLNPESVEFIVRGKLDALGVIFRADASEDESARWHGIRCEPGSKYILDNCIIEDADTGVECMANTNYINKCSFINNNVGILFAGDVSPNVNYTKFLSNNIGVRIRENAHPNLGNLENYSRNDNGYNTFDNKEYDIINETPNLIYAQNNRWGTWNLAKIDRRIFDDGESEESGEVKFIPFREFPDSYLFYGDINADGKIDHSDAMLILKGSVKIIELDEEQRDRADVSGDNIVNSLDAILIMQYATGIIEQFAVIR